MAEDYTATLRALVNDGRTEGTEKLREASTEAREAGRRHIEAADGMAAEGFSQAGIRARGKALREYGNALGWLADAVESGDPDEFGQASTWVQACHGRLEAATPPDLRPPSASVAGPTFSPGGYVGSRLVQVPNPGAGLIGPGGLPVLTPPWRPTPLQRPRPHPLQGWVVPALLVATVVLVVGIAALNFLWVILGFVGLYVVTASALWRHRRRMARWYPRPNAEAAQIIARRMRER